MDIKHLQKAAQLWTTTQIMWHILEIYFQGFYELHCLSQDKCQGYLASLTNFGKHYLSTDSPSTDSLGLYELHYCKTHSLQYLKSISLPFKCLNCTDMLGKGKTQILLSLVFIPVITSSSGKTVFPLIKVGRIQLRCNLFCLGKETSHTIRHIQH